MNVEELEKLRKKAKNKILICVFSGILGAILVGVLTNFIEIAVFIFFLGIILSSILTYKPQRKFKLAFKKTFVLKSLKNVFDNLKYEPERELDRSIIANTEMMNMGDRYSSNDYVSGKYKNINVVQADVHIEEEHTTRDSDGNTSTTYVTIFRGKWMIFDFNKNFKANVQVRQEGFGNAKCGGIGTKLKYNKVLMEDQDFNNKFKVYAQDEHEAFYILTPALMEKIKNVSSKVKGELLFCFVDNKLHIGMYNNKDSFEHSIFKKINEEKIINEISKDIKLVTDFIDELSLDNDLFVNSIE